jgi:hypothetical protein
MDLKTFIHDLQKYKTIGSQFQLKLGELTLQASNTNLVELSSKESVFLLIKTLHEYLCHNYYLDYTNIKKPIQSDLAESGLGNQQSSFYDNSMNLILVITAKLAKVSPLYARCIIDTFVEHIIKHTDCINYIISFYRLYITCSNIKLAAKDYNLYNNLFDYYKKIYNLSNSYEFKSEKDNLRGMKAMCSGDRGCENSKELFLDHFKISKNDQPGKYSNNSLDVLSDDDRRIDTSGSQSNDFKKSQNMANRFSICK